MGEVDGWPAVEWVAGMGLAMVLSAGILYLRSRSFRDTPSEPATYRSAGSPGSDTGAEMRATAIAIIAIGALSQLLYVGLYFELACWVLGAREPPRLTGALFVWVFIVDATCAGAALYTSFKRSD
ncbi:MAG: hypothetical protein HOO96_02510 [Polyangiaceae bacterium]|nr:hypothetical protein [Polyangiaceae bacterium]